jgi:hypothetical protein
MRTAAECLLPHYRSALTEATRAHPELGPPPEDPAEVGAWVRRAELGGRLDAGEAIRIRRLAEKVRFYEERRERELA